MTRQPTLEQALEDLCAQSRGGAIALFAGPPGSGRQRAAQIVADAVGAPLTKVSMPKLVSQYIGETEKNIDRLLRQASASGAVLLFDEADALFGKRSEVADSHDKYANQEVSYLLQRMERSGGIVILSTNRRDAIDPRFISRCHCVLSF